MKIEHFSLLSALFKGKESAGLRRASTLTNNVEPLKHTLHTSAGRNSLCFLERPLGYSSETGHPPLIHLSACMNQLWEGERATDMDLL